VAASLRRFGQQKPIVVQASTRFVVAGNHLVRAAQALGWTEIAANIVDLDDATAVAYMLADNRTADLGWAVESKRAGVAEFLGLTPPAFVRTVVSIGHPTEAALRLKAEPGKARRSIEELSRNL
jgi:ParB-like chromosome segregation protein Spo0J